MKVGRLLRKALRSGPAFRDRAQGVILMYHSVATPAADPWALSVSPEHFAQQLDVLQTRMHVLSLHDFVKRLAADTLPPTAVALTFDDGYLNNLTCAHPLLEKAGIPATIFVATGYLDGKRQFWWDELSRLLLETVDLPETLCLTVGDRERRWRLGASSHYSKAEQERDAGWTYEQEPPTKRHALYLQLWRQLYSLPAGQREQLLSELLSWAGVALPSRSSQHPLNREELQRLITNDLITIGAHTVTHAPLSSHPVAAQRTEIEQSKNDLEALIGTPVNLFAYPHGAYDDNTVSILRQAGFVAACTVEARPVRRGMSPLQLPRVQALNWNGDELEQQITSWRRP